MRGAIPAGDWPGLFARAPNKAQHQVLKKLLGLAIADGEWVTAAKIRDMINERWAEIDKFLCELWDALHPGEGRAQFTLYLPFHDFSNIEALLPLLQ